MSAPFLAVAVLFVISAMLRGGQVYGRVWYVNAAALGNDDGESWADAFNDLQDALAAASAGDEIWVAAAIYRPDRGTADRTMSFNLVSGVGLYGGFAGWETDCEQRDWVTNRTILSGDLMGDDGPNNCEDVSNCCREHEGYGCDDPACNAIMCPTDSTPPVGECCEYLNQPDQHWDQACVEVAKILCCGLGSRQTCDNSLRVVRATACNDQTIFDGFEVERSYYFNMGLPGPDQYGGGLLAENNSSMVVRNCIFRDNEGYGASFWDSPVSFSKSEFIGNFDGAYGGGNAAFTDCTFRENLDAGAVVNGEIAFDRCEATLNGTYGFSLYSDPHVNGRISISNSMIRSNGSAWGIRSLAVVTLSHCTVFEDGIFVIEGAVAAVNSRFTQAKNYPAVVLSESSGTFQNCLFDNGTNQVSNAVVEASGSPTEFRNCTFARNMGRSQPSVINSFGSLGSSPVTLSNCVFWVGDGNEIKPDALLKAYWPPEASFVVDHSIIQGWSGAMGGVGNSGINPEFMDPDGPDDIPGNEDDDFRLAPGSQGINGGNPGFVPAQDETDLDGHARVLCGAVDVGAYEFGAGDLNCDQEVDLSDQTGWPGCMTSPTPSAVQSGCEAFDFNADSDVDLSDYANLQRVFVAP